jgi:hypothetical protein
VERTDRFLGKKAGLVEEEFLIEGEDELCINVVVAE